MLTIDKSIDQTASIITADIFLQTRLDPANGQADAVFRSVVKSLEQMKETHKT